jgi:nucleoside phosphorylase
MRFVLIVGIAGAAPSPKEDIRLGDVVLGTQVVPWNTGKWTQHGFQQTGMARAPPRELLEAITFLDQRFWSPDELLLSKAIEGIASKAPNRAAFLRPTKDCLYKPGFAHTELICDCLQAESELPEQLSSRGSRDGEPVRVFQGAIGSDDVVMKDAQTRDAVTKRENIFCFEMEADGVMDIISCLVFPSGEFQTTQMNTRMMIGIYTLRWQQPHGPGNYYSRFLLVLLLGSLSRLRGISWIGT